MSYLAQTSTSNGAKTSVWNLKTPKLSEETRQNPTGCGCGTGLSELSFHSGIKANSWQRWRQATKTAKYSKGNSEDRRRLPVGANVCYLHIWEGINVHSIQGSQKPELKQTTQFKKKWDMDLNREISKEEIKTDKKYLKVLNILSNYRDAN